MLVASKKLLDHRDSGAVARSGPHLGHTCQRPQSNLVYSTLARYPDPDSENKDRSRGHLDRRRLAGVKSQTLPKSLHPRTCSGERRGLQSPSRASHMKWQCLPRATYETPIFSLTAARQKPPPETGKDG